MPRGGGGEVEEEGEDGCEDREVGVCHLLKRQAASSFSFFCCIAGVCAFLSKGAKQKG